MKNKPIISSFSSGETSAFMTKFLRTHFSDRTVISVIANTGVEDERSLIFADRCDKEWNLNLVWLEADINAEFGKGTRHKVVNFETASRNGEPFEAMIKKYGLPNKAFPHCTRELKRRVIDSYIKNELQLEDYEVAIGIRADEAHRINRQEAAKNNWIYPLVDLHPVTKLMVKQFWEQQPFQLGLREEEGNCKFCWKKSDKKLVLQINDKPDDFKWCEEMDSKYSNLVAPNRSPKIEPSYMFRRNRSAKEMRALAESVGAAQNGLFGQLSEEETDCFCKLT